MPDFLSHTGAPGDVLRDFVQVMSEGRPSPFSVWLYLTSVYLAFRLIVAARRRTRPVSRRTQEIVQAFYIFSLPASMLVNWGHFAGKLMRDYILPMRDVFADLL